MCLPGLNKAFESVSQSIFLEKLAALQAGEEWLENCLMKKDLGVLVKSSELEPGVPRWPRRPMASWLVSAIVWPAGLREWIFPVLVTGMAAPQILCSVQATHDKDIEVVSREGQRSW